VQRGNTDEEEKPQNASLLKGMVPEQIDLETALKLLSLPRNLGNHPEKQEPIEAQNGRYGPYIKCGTDTRSLPADISPLDVTMEQAVYLLSQPKQHGRGATKKPPIKMFDPSPVTEKPVQILEGRFGPYITDGTTNVSLRKGMMPEEITFDEALGMLADKAALGPAPKKATKKKAATKKAPAKKASPKKAVTKKATAKKAAKKKSS